jgi:exopolyphosphatase/guanosine-5'-triphosphate,3'-diphosphate pyrophosphatase
MKPERDSFIEGKNDISAPENVWAVVDLGTNTFQYVVGNMLKGGINIYARKKTGVKIGKGGMGKRQILPEAKARAIETLLDFQNDFNCMKINPNQVFLYGTSAFRNAENRGEVLSAIQEATGYPVQIIDGEKEAEFIFEGVLGSGAILENETQLIVDIGGGSVEFILCKGKTPVWKKSFEVGGLRLLEKFQTQDPIPQEKQKELQEFAEMALGELWNTLISNPIDCLVGCSGSFETLAAMEMARNGLDFSDLEEKGCISIPLKVFQFWANHLIPLPLSERLKIPGMMPLRAEMMVMAVLLIQLILNKTAAKSLRVSTYSLKEGALIQILSNQK